MRTSIRGILAASSFAVIALAATPAAAQDVPGPVEVSVNAAVVSDYRFRGVSLSGGDVAVQGGLDVAHESGFYVGTWASTIDGGPVYGDVELDIYAGFATDIGPGVGLDVGILYYAYPDGDIGEADYWEPYASITGAVGPVETTLGVAYAWEQDSLGGDDNLYVYLDAGIGVPNTPLTITGHVGYTDGVLAPDLLAGGTDENGWDYSVGAALSLPLGFEASVAYVGTDGLEVDSLTDDTVVGALGWSYTF